MQRNQEAPRRQTKQSLLPAVSPGLCFWFRWLLSWACLRGYRASEIYHSMKAKAPTGEGRGPLARKLGPSPSSANGNVRDSRVPLARGFPEGGVGLGSAI